MVVVLAREQNLPLINIVRKEEQVKLLKDMGAEHVLNSTDKDFLDQLGDLAKQLRATVCFEAIGGKMTGQVMSRMPSKSVCIVYGVLSEQPIGDVDPLLIIGRNQRIEGFLLNLYMEQKSTWGLLGIVNKAGKLIANKTIHSEVANRISLFEVREAIPEYKNNMTAGKYLIYPHQVPRQAQGEETGLIQKEEEKNQL